LRRIFYTNQFKKDFKQVQAQGKDIEALKQLINILVEGKEIPKIYDDHPLHGEWKSRRDCHIKGNWILIYTIEGDILRLERTGSHQELFKNY
jgi:mRNA interferase YafQ